MDSNVAELCQLLKNLLSGSTNQPPMALPDMDTSMPALQDGTKPQQDNQMLQAMQELLLLVKLPTTPQMRQVALSALESEPQLMEAFLNYRELIKKWQLQYEQLNEQLMQQQLQQQGMHVGMQGGSIQQPVMCQPVSSQMMEWPNHIPQVSSARQQLARDILEANPPLMAAFLKHKALVSQQQQHQQQGTNVGMQQQVMHQHILSQMMEGPPNPGMELPQQLPHHIRQGLCEIMEVMNSPIPVEQQRQQVFTIIESNPELRDAFSEHMEFEIQQQRNQQQGIHVGMQGGSVQSGNMPGGMQPNVEGGMGPVDPLQQQLVHSQQPQTPH